MLLVRRHAPEGSYFEDGDRASGVFGVLATGFAILLGLIVVIAFTSFDASRSGAETEAVVVAQQFETAEFMPAAIRPQLAGDLICYARSVVHQEWPLMAAGKPVPQISVWSASLFQTLRTAKLVTPAEQSAYDRWFSQRADRQTARYARLHGADGVIPTQLWIALF